ncbi:UvrD-helicase domain-containing protein [Rhabdothermincola salaria]|uniref:UvrD-helicase domain-containing protein n=1 Tax=Rhabdothermincola salaria TaxID=2903142 RepID=UPI001E555F90|nr:UvrD-helicase domain-containing protein [Rhabdothermincola salaria]MCD9625532.1 UvrD-helicase domain-containing protein [Rhabdothermincola salaria]
MSDDLLSGLNPVQHEAVTHTEGPLLIVAGAGSGKTRVLTHRIAHLIRDLGVSPFEILAITFTNKAADEMKHRVAELVGPVAEKMWVSTFHSACVRILRRDGHLLGFPSSFTIYDQADAVRLAGYVIRDLGLDSKRFPPRSVQAIISAAKNDGVGPVEYAERAKVIFERKIADVFTEYQARLLKAGAMDFDDLLANAVRLLREHPEVLEHYRRRFQHVLVDEYQDTNRVQNDLVLLLTQESGRVCVVGDADQCLPAGTMVRTPTGEVPVEQVRVGDEVLGADGGLEPAVGRVREVVPGRYKGTIVTVHAGGRTLTGTPHHIVPARMTLNPGQWVVYLMHRADRGWRIGQCKSVRSDDRGNAAIGVRVRANQEGADAVWVLQVCDSPAEASYWEARFAADYGLPTACFHGIGRRLSMDEEWLERLYATLDTESRAKQLMSELHLHPEFPHHRPQNGARRATVNLTMFSDRRRSRAGHRVQWSSNREAVADLLRAGGLAVRPGRLPGTARFETSRTDYVEAVELARRVADAGGLAVRRRMLIDGEVYDFTPLAHLRPGMVLLAEGANGWEEVAVDEVVFDHHDGPVYDLEVAATYSYAANGILNKNSIYKFRGADMRNIVDFEDAFPEVTVVLLEQNYRSSQTILDAANAVIANNLGRKPKELWTEAGAGEAIVRYHADDEGDEAQWVAHQLMHLHDGGQHRWGDCAVFYRTNAQSRVVEEYLMRVGIPYKVVGGTRFYDRREVKDAIAYLRAANNPADEVSVKRVLNVPKRGVGDSTVGRLDVYARAHGLTFLDTLREAPAAGVTGRAVKGIEQFLALHEELIGLIPEGPAAVLEAALQRSGYVAELEAEHSIEAEGRIENLAELVGAARDFGSVDEFLEQISLVADTDDLDGDESSVVLMTLHSAKGLEFPVVFLVGLEDGVFPHLRSIGEPDELEEERRLAYVGITRARERLYLSHAWARNIYGGTQYNPPSRFLDEIPEGLVQQIEGNRRASRRPASGSWGGSGSSGSRGFGGGGGGGYGRGRRSEDDEWTGSVIGGRSRHRDDVVEAALKPTAPEPSGADKLGLAVGDDVHHQSFGDGVITAIEGTGDKTVAHVHFAGGVGSKQLLLSWAPLEKR